MFSGPEAQLMQDAFIIAVLALVAGMAFGYAVLRYRGSKTKRGQAPKNKTKLEERVEVLERIATDRSIDLAEEIDALKSAKETA